VYSNIVEPKVELHIVNEDEADNKILECALAAGADIIVSGDKHLLNLGKFKKTRILTPREFFDSLT
jgi:putative PIN family toxin of toxin-antitoxin system